MWPGPRCRKMGHLSMIAFSSSFRRLQEIADAESVLLDLRTADEAIASVLRKLDTLASQAELHRPTDPRALETRRLRDEAAELRDLTEKLGVLASCLSLAEQAARRRRPASLPARGASPSGERPISRHWRYE